MAGACPRPADTGATTPGPEDPRPTGAAPGDDRDRDGIPDEADACPDDPEDRDGFEDGDGCPDPDNDNDRIPDPYDACPRDPEDRDDFEDGDGCPDPDNDNDRIPDADDMCPNEPETYNGLEDQDGCPDQGRVIVSSCSIAIGGAAVVPDELLVIAEAERSGLDAPGGDAAEAPPADRPAPGALEVRNEAGETVAALPLEHTEVSAEITGYLARAVVEQRFGNPFDDPIEATYVFPLPTGAAVNDFVMEVAGRRIVGVVRPREEAERIYREAREMGYTASLLTQERPNVFTQNVANIEPGGNVTVRIAWFERLAQEEGEYQWVFPMVVGPRYVAGTPVGEGASASTSGGGGWSPPTDRVPDADRITPPVLPPGRRSGHDIGLRVTLEAGIPIASVETPAHRATIESPSSSKRIVRLSATDSIPNRDFVLRWRVKTDETRVAALAHRADAGGYVTLMVQPDLAPAEDEVSPREITFVLDVSGSMSGLPLSISKDLVRRALHGLRPDDAFNLFYFASGNGQLWERARVRSSRNVREALEFLERTEAGGGTEMMAGLRRALETERDPARLRMVVFLTDGYVGEDDAILGYVRNERGDTRFLAFGIGASVNRHLIEGVGRLGGGGSHVVIPRDDGHAERATARLFRLIDAPVLADVSIDWNGLPVEDVYPSPLPDLYAGGTIDLVARYREAASGTAYVEGRVGTRRVRLPVEVVLPEAEPANAALAPLWARRRIADWMDDWAAESDAAERERLAARVTELAVEHRLVTRFTAFTAVDESRVVGDGRPPRVTQPVEMPEGVSHEGVFGAAPRGR
jgi:Ca-activated chloride channel family protein